MRGLKIQYVFIALAIYEFVLAIGPSRQPHSLSVNILNVIIYVIAGLSASYSIYLSEHEYQTARKAEDYKRFIDI